MTAGTIDRRAASSKPEPMGLRPAAALLALALGMAPIQKANAQTPAPNTLPAGGQVSAGQASITQSGSQLSVDQGSSRAIINWQSFSIGSQAEVDFHQPNASSVALNRVVTGIPSQIYGKLTANGQVFLVNPGGILFGPGAQVNIGGLVATTMALSDPDFLAGNYVFNRNGATAAVENQGTIVAPPGGMIALLAPTVVNQGAIVAPGGAVIAAAGEKIALTIDGGVSVQVDPALVQTLIDNRAMIAAPGGRVILTAQAVDTVLGGAINNSGVIEAGSIHDNGGTVTLDAGGSLTDSGVIDASGAEVGGTVTLSGRSIKLAEAQIAAIGDTAGGSIAVGGSATGVVSVDATSELDASARTTGNGGAIYVYGRTDSFAGTALARGGALGGNGGQVETSGESLDVAGARIDTSAPNGRAGSWLLDPFDLTVDTAAATTIATDLGTTNVTLKTTATTTSGPGSVSAGEGDITVAAAISAPLATNSLTLSAFRDVNVNAPITTGGAVTLQADNTAVGGGTVNYGLGGAVVAGGGLTAYSGTGSSEAPTTGTLLDASVSTTSTSSETSSTSSETITSTDPLSTPLVEVSDSSVAVSSTTAETTVTAGETTATVGGTEGTTSAEPTASEPTASTTPTETTVTAGETTATVGGTEGTTSTEPTVSEPTVSTTPTETTATTGETTATVSGTEGTTSTEPTVSEPAVSTTPTETTVTTGGTTATVGTGGTENTTTTEPTVSTTPTETTAGAGGTTVTVGTGSGTAGGTAQGGNAIGGTPTGNGGAVPGSPSASASSIARQPAVLPQTVRSVRLLRAAKGARELMRVVVETGDTSNGFRFALPDKVTHNSHGSIAEMPNGKPLPSWLVYHPENFSFAATTVPAGGLPVSVVVITVRENGTTHRISVAIQR